MFDPEIEFFGCVCDSDEHQLILRLWDWEDGDVELSMSVFLCDDLGFWGRLWAGVKYIFGYKCRYGHFESATIKPGDIDRLAGLLKKYKEKLTADTSVADWENEGGK